MSASRRNPLRLLSLSWVLGFVTLWIVIPLLALLSRAWSQEGSLGLTDPTVLAIARATAEQAAWSVFFSAVPGLALGLWIGAGIARGARSSRWSQIFLALPYGVPTVVVGWTGIAWLGRSGLLAQWGLPLDWAYSLKAVVLAHVFLNLPWIALRVAQARAQVPGALLGAARSLGARKPQVFGAVVWPQIRWDFLAASVQVFSLCTMSFALILLLGGGPPVETLETGIYYRIRAGSLDLPGAIGCAIWELLINLIPLVALLLLRRSAPSDLSAVSGPVPALIGAGRRKRAPGIGAILAIAVCALPVIPYAVLFSPRSIAFEGLVWPEILAALGISLRLAVTSAVFAVSTAVFGVLAIEPRKRERSLLHFIFALPAGVSVLVLGLGVWLAYSRWVDPFEGSFWAIAGLQGTLLVPVAFRTLWPVALGMRARQLEAARSLGASALQAFRWIEWPRWRAPLLVALAICIGAALGEVAAVSLFSSEKIVPLPLLMTRWMGQYRFEEAQVIALLLFILSTGAIAFVSAWGIVGRNVRE